jgi:zinc protease
MSEMEKYEWPDVKVFYDTWYAPNNAILVVSGDITAKELKPLAEKYYGGIGKKNVPARKRPEIPPAIGSAVLTLHDPSIHQSLFQKDYLAPTEAHNRADSLALQVLEEILSGGPSARLYKNIVVKEKKATGVDFNYNANMLDYGSISIGGTPANNVSPQDLEAAMDAEIDKVIKDGVSETEVKEAILRLQDQAVFARDSIAGPAMIFGAALSTGSSVKDVETWPEDIARVTPSQVQAATAKYLDDTHPWIRPPVTGYLLPQDKEEAAPDSKDSAENGATNTAPEVGHVQR